MEDSTESRLGCGTKKAETDTPTMRGDVKMLAYWLSLGAAAGGSGGALIGGIGGRIAMFILRLTSDDSVRGLESDDGFIIGRFDLTATVSLIFVTSVLGAIVGLIVVAGQPFFPKRGMPFAWALAGAITGGALLISEDGIDFTLLGPHALAVALFIAIPAIGAGSIAWLTEVYPRFWWRNRPLTALAAIPAAPLVIFFPVAIFALLVCGIWLLALQLPRVRAMPAWKPIRALATVVFGLIVTLGLLDLVGDVRAII